jgi:hypothetical protein
MTSANGSLLFLRSEAVAGIAFKVERIYFGLTLACGEGVTEDFQSLSAPSMKRVRYAYICGKDDRWWRLVKVRNMEGLALQADVDRL